MKIDFDKVVKEGVEQAMQECELTIGMTLKEAVEKQIPKKVKIEKYAPTRCNCGFEFSVHYGDGYYSIPFELKTPYCRNCGQALDWGDKNDRA